MFRQIRLLENTHTDGVAVLAVDKEFMNQFTFHHKAEFTVDVDGFFVLFIDDQIQLI